MTKPRGYMRTAEEQLFWLVTLCLPHVQALVFAGIRGMLSLLLLTFLLLFVVARSPAIYRAIAARLKDLPVSWATPVLDRRDQWVAAHLQVVASGPSLAASFQRPPPLLS